MGEELREKTPDPQTKEVEAPRSQEPEGTILALGGVPPSGDVDLGGASRLGQSKGDMLRWPLARCPQQGPMERAWPNQRPPREKEGTSRPGARPP